MTHRTRQLRDFARAIAACAALLFVLTSPVLVRADGNACTGCQNTGDVECGVTLSFIVDGCCGNWVDGYGQCVSGYGYAIVCENGRQCMCNSQGQECDIVRVAG